MGLLTSAIARIKAPNTERLPVSAGSGILSIGEGSTASNRSQQLGSIEASGWLFATVDRIASAVARSQWMLFRNGGGDREEVTDHALLDLWKSPSPFYTRPEFLSFSGNHFGLVGEIWWVIVRDSMGFGLPVELQPVRPDRIRPVPSPDDFISGYIYQVGSTKIPLDREDVIFTRRPSPIDPYRGIGPLGSLMFDLGSEKAAAQWTSSFFRNSALPGGIIEMDEEMRDDDFDRFVARWRQQHQGVNNAHRVAIIERGQWKDRAFSQRDMQFEQMRKLNRDIILGAYGMPASILGVSENVNRANAEAAEVLFARWIVVPILELVKEALNQHLVAQVDSSLEFGYQDPTPANREQNLKEAVQGWTTDFFTQNEARARVDLGADPQGDQYRSERFPRESVNPFNLGMKELATTKAENPLRPDEVNDEEDTMTRNWRIRLADEAQAISSLLEQFKSRQKLDISDIDIHDWDWWRKYGGAVIGELTDAFAEAMITENPEAGPDMVQNIASDWALERAGRLLRLDGGINLVAQTRNRVRELVSETISRGDSLQTLQKRLREDLAFSPERARRIARTETATALGEGQMGAAKSQGRDEKRWVTQGDSQVSQEVCAPNEAQGWIKLGDPFQSGHRTIPGHVNCRCTVRYRTAELHQENILCPQCKRRLPVRGLVGSATVYCKRCDREINF